MEQILNYIEYIIIGFIFLILILIIINLNLKLTKVEKKVVKFLNSNDEFSIESLLLQYFQKIEKVEQENFNIHQNIDEIQKKLKLCISKTSLVRYNPFEDTGGNFCYALALLNENNDGVILNNIFSREGCYNYAKPIINGVSENHKLSQEEKIALENAMNYVDNQIL